MSEAIAEAIRNLERRKIELEVSIEGERRFFEELEKSLDAEGSKITVDGVELPGDWRVERVERGAKDGVAHANVTFRQIVRHDPQR